MSTQRNENVDRNKSLVLNLGRNTAGLIMSGAFAAKPPQPPKLRKDATAAGRRHAMALGLVTEGMFAQKLGWSIGQFKAAMGNVLPEPDACTSPAAWRSATANIFMEFMGRAERFAVPAGAITGALTARVDADAFAARLGKTVHQFAQAVSAGQLPPTVKFNDGKHGWTLDAVIGHLLTARE